MTLKNSDSVRPLLILRKRLILKGTYLRSKEVPLSSSSSSSSTQTIINLTSNRSTIVREFVSSETKHRIRGTRKTSYTKILPHTPGSLQYDFSSHIPRSPFEPQLHAGQVLGSGTGRSMFLGLGNDRRPGVRERKVDLLF